MDHGDDMGGRILWINGSHVAHLIYAFPKVNNEEENAVIVRMAEMAAAIDNNTGRDYWMGGVRLDNGWKWRSGDSMDYTDWNGNNPGGGHGGGDFTQLLRNNYPAYNWATAPEHDGDNCVICEMRSK